MTRFDTYAEALRLRERALSEAIEVAFGLKSPAAGRNALGWWYYYAVTGAFDRRHRFERLIDDCHRLELRFEKRFETALASYPR